MGNAWLFPSVPDSTGKCSKIHSELSGCFSIFFHVFPKSADSFKEQTEKTDKIKSVFLKKKKSIPDMLELKATYIKKRRGHGCNFIKKRNIIIY